MSDFRIKTEFFNHPKTQRLLRLLGADGVLALLRLWSFAATTFPDGVLRGMDASDIETAAGWCGEPDAFYKAIISEKMRFLDSPDTDGGDHCLHDWEEHQPWVVNAPARQKQASRAATIRWGKDTGNNPSRNFIGANADSIAVSMPGAMPLSFPFPSSPSPSLPSLSFPNKGNKSADAPLLEKPVLKKPAFEIPDWIPKPDWDDFIEMRKKSRKPPTDRAKRDLVNDLEKLKAQGHNPALVLEQSIKNNWQGLFAIKADFKKGGGNYRTAGNLEAVKKFNERFANDEK